MTFQISKNTNHFVEVGKRLKQSVYTLYMMNESLMMMDIEIKSALTK